MITRPGFPPTTDPDNWMGRSGNASYYPFHVQFKQQGGQIPAGALVLHTGGAVTMAMVKPTLMMDPSDSTTWQRPYQFTGGVYGQ